MSVGLGLGIVFLCICLGSAFQEFFWFSLDCFWTQRIDHLTSKCYQRVWIAGARVWMQLMQKKAEGASISALLIPKPPSPTGSEA